MQHGVVKWFNPERGYGFIESKGKDYFAHYNQIIGKGFRSLVAGQEVTFSEGTSPKGKIAMNIVPFSNSCKDGQFDALQPGNQDR